MTSRVTAPCSTTEPPVRGTSCIKVQWVLKDKEKLKVNGVIHGLADGQFDRFVDSVRIYHCLCEGQLSECL